MDDNSDEHRIPTGIGSDAIRSGNFFLPLGDQQTQVFGLPEGKQVIFSGIGLINDRNNKHVFPILQGEESTFSKSSVD